MTETPRDVVQVGFVTGEGGDAMQMLELAAGIAHRGCAVRVIVPDMPSTKTFGERCSARQVPVERSAWVRAGIHGAQQDVVGLVKLFKRHRDAVLHLHTGDVCPPRRVLIALAVVRPQRVFVTIHCPYDTLNARDIRARIWAAAARMNFRRVVCPSRNGLEAQLRYGVPQSRVQVIRNCVDLDRVEAGDPVRARRAIGAPPDAPIVLFSSRMEPQKRPLDALEAFLSVEAEFPNAHCVFVGSGTLEEKVKARAEASPARSRIHVLGYQCNIPDWLAAATAWIMPTESENFSIALLEALAAGCPIISTLCQGNDEVLINCQNALVTAVGDVTGQAQALRSVLSDINLRDRLSAGARKTGRRYGAEQMVDEYLRCYAAV